MLKKVPFISFTNIKARIALRHELFDEEVKILDKGQSDSIHAVI